MRKLSVFNLITLDGYFAGEGGDISWHMVDDEFQEVANTVANGGNTLIFGRVTYEMMASYWQTPEALRDDPLIAKGMNAAEKIVFSRTLDKVYWHNTRLVNTDLITEIKRLKALEGLGLTVLGSGSLVAQLAAADLIDEYQILLNPVVLGQGRTMFAGVAKKITLKLTANRVFSNGNLLLTYEPVRE